ncbi:MAG: hypothetical protein AAGC77_08215 [Pseudomonadota bacterium]
MWKSHRSLSWTESSLIGTVRGDDILSMWMKPMTMLEKAVRDLAGALETLEETLEQRLDETAAGREQIAAARLQAQAARTHADEASKGLNDAVRDLKAILASAAEKPEATS